jgi:tRNA threonylcarbamoyladenosine biosynthesis protein TsaB
MGLLLSIDASSRTYAVAAGTGDRPDALRTARRGDPGFEGVGGLASAAVADLHARFRDVEAIAVDTGPGGLSSIRSAVAYANGLAFSLGVRVFPVTSLELMAIAAEGATGAKATAADPVLSLKRAQGGNVYAGLFADGEMTVMRHGQPGEILPELTGGLAAVRLAGLTAADLAGLVPGAAEAAPDSAGLAGLTGGAAVTETGILEADVTVLYETAKSAVRDPRRLVTLADALNEGSPVFHPQASPVAAGTTAARTEEAGD